MSTPFEYCIFIGRFSAFHLGHLAILNQALSIAKEVIVVIGSSTAPRSVRNPWTVEERQEMICSSLPKEVLQRVKFVHMKDYLYNNNLWVSILQEKLATATNDSENVALIGFESDETSFYLRLFPQFKYIEHGTECDIPPPIAQRAIEAEASALGLIPPQSPIRTF